MIAAPPDGPFERPLIVAELAGDRAVKPVWSNLLGGLTFQFGEGPGREFLKWTPHGNGVDLSAETRRLAWAGRYTKVPRVLAQGSDEQGSWFLSAGVPGDCAVDERWKRQPLRAARAIGAGLRELHEALPVDDCPFDEWTAEARVGRARKSAAEGRMDTATWNPDTVAYAGGVPRVLEIVAEIPPIDRLVVCHGDSCAPNTLIGEDGTCSGHVDFDALGVADRWADLAVASWSTIWNYGPGFEEPLFEAYGVAPDRERIRYYRTLWDIVD